MRRGGSAPVAPFVSIQHLRALAALSVAAYHALQWSGGGFDVGRAGVDVFFVISGVVMWTSTAGRAISPLRFLQRRAVRLAPPYWIATLVIASTAWVWPAFLPQILPGVAHLVKSLAFIPHFDPRGLPFPTLPLGWSLDYEAIFYVVFAGALFTPEAWRSRLVTGVLMGIVAIGFLADDPLYILGANPMLLQFAAGVWLGVGATSRALPSRSGGWILIAVAAALWLLVQSTGLFREFWRPFEWGVPAAMLVAGVMAVERHGVWPKFPILERLGDASYSLYLWHPAVIALTAHVVGVRFIGFAPLALVLSALAGLASYAWIERPLLRALRPG